MKFWGSSVLGLIVIALVASPTVASAADQLWWSNYNPPGSISRVDPGSAAATSVISGTPEVNGPYGTAADPASGKIYWVSYDSSRIATAQLDGTGKRTVLDTTINHPYGLAIDAGGGHLFWAEKYTNTIRRVGTDGLGSTPLYVDSANVVSPVVDPKAQRIYWVRISYPQAKIANGSLDGVAGEPIPIPADCPYGASTGPGSIAVDSERGVIYMGTAGGSTGIAKMNLDGSGCQAVTATTASPTGLALDPDGQKLYWADYGNHALRYVNLNPVGTEQTLVQGSPTVSYPAWPNLIKSPAGSATVTPTTAEIGEKLTCTAAWSQGAVAASMYRAPQTTGYAWKLDGETVSGATGSALTTDRAGSYECIATGTNAAGSTELTSASATVSGAPTPDPEPIPPLPPLPPIPAPSNTFTVSVAGSNGSSLRTRVTVPGPGTLRQRGRRTARASGSAATSACSASRNVTKAGTYTISCQTTAATRRARQRGTVRIVLTTSFTPTGGSTASSSRVVALPALKPRYTG